MADNSKLEKVRTRRELFGFLEEQMNASYRQVLSSRRLENESTQVKTYLLEFDWYEQNGHKNELDYLTNALSISPSRRSKRGVSAQLKETEENGFYVVEWLKGKQPLRLFLDTSTDKSRRFWIGYSLSAATEIDWILDKLASAEASIDRIWLWPSLLREAQDWGEFRGFGLDFDHRYFEDENQIAESTSYLKMQLWSGPQSLAILDEFNSANSIAGKAVLSKVRLKYIDEDDDSQFALEDIKYNGKFTCRGTSFESHQRLVTQLRTKYAETVRELEKNHTIKCCDQGTDLSVNGDPVFFKFKQPTNDIAKFCDIAFSGFAPFYIWGLRQEIDDGLQITAVDMHTGSNLMFEVFPEEIIMYLYKGSCGNTVVRFFTNLQRTMGTSITAQDINGKGLFQFARD